MNPASATRCDCGYRFVEPTAEATRSGLTRDQIGMLVSKLEAGTRATSVRMWFGGISTIVVFGGGVAALVACHLYAFAAVPAVMGLGLGVSAYRSSGGWTRRGTQPVVAALREHPELIISIRPYKHVHRRIRSYGIEISTVSHLMVFSAHNEVEWDDVLACPRRHCPAAKLVTSPQR